MIIVSIISVIYAVLQRNVWVDAAFQRDETGGRRDRPSGFVEVLQTVPQSESDSGDPALHHQLRPCSIVMKVSMIALILVMLALSTTANLLDMRRRKKRMEEDI
ncbi:MAG: hypothetical protein ACOX0D_00380 [Sphaerochaeta sp.]